jgi:hypothetical protein
MSVRSTDTPEIIEQAKNLFAAAKKAGNLKILGIISSTAKSTGLMITSSGREATWESYLPEARRADRLR